ncbi:MAG: hypothetical protein WCS27_04290 [Victivallaceae bacterium]
MVTSTDWSELLCIAREQPLVLHNRQSFCIFPNDMELPLSIITLSTARNFVAYQIHLIVELYYPSRAHPTKDIANYLNNIALLIKQGDNPRLFIVNNTPLSSQDAKKVLTVIKQLPVPPETVSEKIHIVHNMIRRLIELLDYPSEQSIMQLYCLAIEWMKLLGTGKLQLFEVKKPLEYAQMHLRQHIRRIDHHTSRSIEWGREYNSYYRKYLSEGLCDQTARSKAREDFCSAHPVPVTDEELLCAYAAPGVSRQSIRKYHQVFLKFQAKGAG